MKKLFLLILVLVSAPLLAQTDSARQTSAKLEKEVTVKVELQFLVYLPPEYKNDDKKWPLVLFLHGAGERGEESSLGSC